MAPCEALIGSLLQAWRLPLACWQGAGGGEFMALAVSARRCRWRAGLRGRLGMLAQRMQSRLHLSNGSSRPVSALVVLR